MKPRCFTCDGCGGHFECGWSEEEAQAEKVANGFGDLPEEDQAIVCDDCYQQIMGIGEVRQ